MSIDRLHNWGRYCREHCHPKSCGSAEKFYRPPPNESVDEEKRRRPLRQPDVIDGAVVEEAWKKLSMPMKMVLKFTYVYPRGPRIVERMAKIAKGSYKYNRERAECEIFHILRQIT